MEKTLHQVVKGNQFTFGNNLFTKKECAADSEVIINDNDKLITCTIGHTNSTVYIAEYAIVNEIER